MPSGGRLADDSIYAQEYESKLNALEYMLYAADYLSMRALFGYLSSICGSRTLTFPTVNWRCCGARRKTRCESTVFVVSRDLKMRVHAPRTHATSSLTSHLG